MTHKRQNWTAREIRELVRSIDEFLEVVDEGAVALVFDILEEEPPADIRGLPEQMRGLRAVLKSQLKPQEKP
jgi:hypothetical protein